MPYADADDKRRHARETYRKKRAAALEALPPPPEQPPLWDYQEAIRAILEYQPPPGTLSIRKGTRLGVTTFELRFAADCARAGLKVGIWLPDQTLAGRVSKTMFKPLISESELSERASTFLYQFDGGGMVNFGWAGTPTQFRQAGFDVAIGDEWPSLSPDLGHEGRGDVLLRSRVKSSENPRVILSGSPSTAGDALQAVEATSSLKLEWKEPCPECGRGVSARLDRLSEAGLACEHCGTISPQEAWPPGRFEGEEDPTTYVRDGGLIVDGEPAPWPASVTLILRGLLAPNIPWQRHLQDLEACGDDPSALKALYSVVDAELNVAAAGRIKELLAMRRPVERREGARLVCGVDVQHDRLEATMAQLGPDSRIDVLTHLVLEGETVNATEGAWSALTAVLAEWKPALSLIDSGDRTRVVYEYVRRHRGTRAIKGRRELANGRLWTWSPPKPDEGKPIGLYSLDVDVLRRTWMNRLDSAKRGDWFTFDSDLDRAYFESLTAEREIVTRSKRTGAYIRGWTSTAITRPATA